MVIIDLSQKSVFNHGTIKHNDIQLYTNDDMVSHDEEEELEKGEYGGDGE